MLTPLKAMGILHDFSGARISPLTIFVSFSDDYCWAGVNGTTHVNNCSQCGFTNLALYVQNKLNLPVCLFIVCFTDFYGCCTLLCEDRI